MNIGFAQIRGALVIEKGCIGNKWVTRLAAKKAQMLYLTRNSLLDVSIFYA